MIGWTIALVVWALGILPSHAGYLEACKSDPELADVLLKIATDGEVKLNAYGVLLSILWPVAELYGLAVTTISGEGIR